MNPKQLKDYFDSAEFAAKYHNTQPMGCFCSQAGTTFRLWAPTAHQVTLNLYRTGHKAETPQAFPLVKKERGLWMLETSENWDGRYYTYLVSTEAGTREIGDPYARACGCNGARSMVIDLGRTDPEGWENDKAPALRKQIPALCSKSTDAGKNVLSVTEFSSGCASVLLDNPHGSSPWHTLLLLYNTGEEKTKFTLPAGSWQVLVGNECSFCWQKAIQVHDRIHLPPVTAVVLGK